MRTLEKALIILGGPFGGLFFIFLLTLAAAFGGLAALI